MKEDNYELLRLTARNVRNIRNRLRGLTAFRLKLMIDRLDKELVDEILRQK